MLGLMICSGMGGGWVEGWYCGTVLHKNNATCYAAQPQEIYSNFNNNNKICFQTWSSNSIVTFIRLFYCQTVLPCAQSILHIVNLSLKEYIIYYIYFRVKGIWQTEFRQMNYVLSELNVGIRNTGLWNVPIPHLRPHVSIRSVHVWSIVCNMLPVLVDDKILHSTPIINWIFKKSTVRKIFI